MQNEVVSLVKNTMESNNISKELSSRGYTILQGSNVSNPEWASTLKTISSEMSDFYQSWQDLPSDKFLSDGGHYRYRRYSVFNYLNDKLEILPHEAHYQSTYRNNMNGGIYRDYEPFKQSTIDNPALKSIIAFVADQISFNNEKQWRIQAHQFRIEANTAEAGKPTPEGIHRDGADFILIMLLGRDNISGGTSHIYDENKNLQFEGKLCNRGDAVLIDDRTVWHGVSEIHPLDKNKPGYRDVLVLTFHDEVLV